MDNIHPCFTYVRISTRALHSTGTKVTSLHVYEGLMPSPNMQKLHKQGRVNGIYQAISHYNF